MRSLGRGRKPTGWTAGAEAPATTGAITLPVSRAFLVQLAADCEPGGQTLRGRVEHVRSGEAARFQSLPELATFMRDVLRQGAKASS
jgi:hypothetical protein